ncbi:UNVERIFIED_CONTAM: hypothetical protein GTU68_031944, partial [Idotea baltica]|nr:hypothetical protein [Idotea baltica]
MSSFSMVPPSSPHTSQLPTCPNPRSITTSSTFVPQSTSWPRPNCHPT